MRTKQLLGAVYLVLASITVGAANADTVYLKTGGKLNGVILQEDAAEIVIRVKVTTCTVKRDEIRDVVRSVEKETMPGTGARLPNWEKCLDVAVRAKWLPHVQAIPATVIDKGVLRHVPYMSFRSGEYELNIYGDPSKPACIEIGVTGSLLKSLDAKKNCLSLVQGILTDPNDKELLKTLILAQDKKDREGVTFEITPETADDAYGGWWVSVYNLKTMDVSRASEKELAEITVKKQDIKQRPAESATITTPTTSKTQGGPASPATASSPSNSAELAPEWNPNDLQYARSVGSGVGGSVYVRGYLRKDGTYVHSHTRSSPRR
jgi:hypothetical protein